LIQNNNKSTQHLVVVAAILTFITPLCATDLSPVGLWKTTDDKTGKPRGLVRVYEEKGKYFGRVEASLDPAEAKRVCSDCRDYRRNEPVIGMVIMREMRKDADGYNGGDILDPDTGAVYRCKFRMEDEGRKLVVRGFIGFSLFGRSQTWIRQP
jgi:uncharacterized protein (DUF2147 family)